MSGVPRECFGVALQAVCPGIAVPCHGKGLFFHVSPGDGKGPHKGTPLPFPVEHPVSSSRDCLTSKRLLHEVPRCSRVPRRLPRVVKCQNGHAASSCKGLQLR